MKMFIKKRGRFSLRAFQAEDSAGVVQMVQYKCSSPTSDVKLVAKEKERI